MVSILYKWFAVVFSLFLADPETALHPVYVSVTEITHNAPAKTLEVSCKIFTDDFEKTLRKYSSTKVDLINPANKNAMEELINRYVQSRLKIEVNDKLVTMKFIGYEVVEEAVVSYYQADAVPVVNTMGIQNNLLYDFINEQINLLHITVNGNRKSTKLTHPTDKVTMQF